MAADEHSWRAIQVNWKGVRSTKRLVPGRTAQRGHCSIGAGKSAGAGCAGCGPPKGEGATGAVGGRVRGAGGGHASSHAAAGRRAATPVGVVTRWARRWSGPGRRACPAHGAGSARGAVGGRPRRARILRHTVTPRRGVTCGAGQGAAAAVRVLVGCTRHGGYPRIATGSAHRTFCAHSIPFARVPDADG